MAVLEITNNNRYLKIERGFIVIEENQHAIGHIAIDAVEAIILSAQFYCLSSQFLDRCLQYNIPVIFCSANFHPTGMLLSCNSHYKNAERLQWQIHAPKPLVKSIWKAIIKAKVLNQRDALRILGLNANDLTEMLRRLRSGDESNIEAQAAKAYWPRIFGDGFRRDPALEGTNAMLNYGYAVIRSCLARHVVASGLHPSLGVHHDNKLNPFCLVDDLIEPFRPMVDLVVRSVGIGSDTTLTPERKKALAFVLETPVLFNRKSMAMKNAAEAMVWTLAETLMNRKNRLGTPSIKTGNNETDRGEQIPSHVDDGDV